MLKQLLFAVCLLPLFCVPVHAVSAAAYAVLDADTGTLLASSHADTELPMASTTKIMTGLLACQQPNLDETIPVPPSCAGIEGSSMYLQAGEELPLREVVYGLLLCSGNDAAECIAEVCGGREVFVARMNDKAAELGLTHTHFDNPSGLDGETHHTTAAELAKLAAHALRNPTFADIVSTVDHSYGMHFMHNHNKMLLRYPDCIGVKTGFTKTSGRCLVSAVKRNGRTLVVATLNAPDDWNDHTALLDTAFASQTTQTVFRAGDTVTTLPVLTGTDSHVDLVAKDTLSYDTFGDETVTLAVQHKGFVYAPVRQGTPCGTAQLLVNGIVVRETPLVAAQSIALDESQEKLNWMEKLLASMRRGDQCVIRNA